MRRGRPGLVSKLFSVSLHRVCFNLLSMNSLLLANLAKNAEEVRTPLTSKFTLRSGQRHLTV